MTTPQTLKGFRDFPPAACRVRSYVKKLLVDTFETFGFQPLETPTLEYTSTLLGKYGDEADKLVYTFRDRGERDIGLRYDLTVPTARFIAQTSATLPLPFKRYQIQPCFRAENTQKGRYREFTQCDIDIFGPISPINDAEIIAVIYNILQKLNFKKYSIRINSRAVLAQILGSCGITANQNSVLQSLDKFQKIGRDGVEKELVSKGLASPQISRLFDSINSSQPDDYLQTVFTKTDAFGVPRSAYSFDPTLVRGLDYYTGPIFETYVEEPKIGSITGGGRYDGLVKLLGGPDLPAVGTTLGLDRLVDCILDLNLLPQLSTNLTKVLVANFGPETEKESLKLLTKLRQNEISSAIYPTPEKLSKQFKYASSLGVSYVAVIGPDEIKNQKIALKNLATGDQQILSSDDLIRFLQPNG